MPREIYEHKIKLRKLVIKDDHALVPLTQSQFAIIDLEDIDKINKYNWCAVWYRDSQTFYAMGWINGKNILMHRFILNVTDPKIQIDHKNSNGLENRHFNIRVCTHQQNQMNKRSAYNSSSQFKGVYWKKQNKKWMASIRYKEKSIYLGYSDSERECAKMYNKAAIKYFGEFARLNDI